MKTLENIFSELKKQGIKEEEIEEKIHTSSMLSFIEASYAVVNEHTMPTPLFRLVYDTQAQNLQFGELKGKAQVPKEGSLDINMLDTLIASLFREKMPLLLEGKTGVGKTYTVEQFMKTILPTENYQGLRLNQNMSNVLQPYVKAELDGASIKRSLRQEQLDNIAAIFIDEVNRGDTNQVLQLQDGVITLDTGERGEVGIPIPRYQNGEWVTNEEDKRPLYVVSAQNPPATKDVKYSGTKRTDAAQNNRNLQIEVPNSASSIGASALLLKSGNGQHESFKEYYKKFLSKKLDLEEEVLSNLDEDYIGLYAFTTDPKRTESPSIQSGIEFMDAMLATVSPSMEYEFEHEKQVTKDWNDVLDKYGIDFTYTSDFDTTSVPIEKLKEIVGSFEEEIVTRDNVKVKKLSDAISLVRRLKSSLGQDNPSEAYAQTPSYITVQDIACGFSIMLHDKQDIPDGKTVSLIDQVLKEYVGVTENFASKVGYNREFNAEDPNMSVYNLAFQHAIKEANEAQDKKYLEGFVKDIGASVAELKRLENGSEYRKPLLARSIADLTTLAGFADQYSSEVNEIFNKDISSTNKRNEFKQLYFSKKQSPTTPDIYLHRLTRVLGV